MPVLIPLSVQHRHVHLSKKDFRRVFGDDVTLTEETKLGHRGQIVYKESVSISGPKGIIHHLRLLGPSREKSQVEISLNDARSLGIRAPIRRSGDNIKSGSCFLTGPNSKIRIASAVIVPARHLHCNDRLAKKLHLKNRQVISLQHIDRPDFFLHHVSVRIHPTFATVLHLTDDEAAEYWLESGEFFHICS